MEIDLTGLEKIVTPNPMKIGRLKVYFDEYHNEDSPILAGYKGKIIDNED